MNDLTLACISVTQMIVAIVGALFVVITGNFKWEYVFIIAFLLESGILKAMYLAEMVEKRQLKDQTDKEITGVNQ